MDTFTDVKIEIFIPESHLDALRAELGAIGVGRIGNYDHCASVLEVRGYWRPLAGATPYAGAVGAISTGVECKVELNCQRRLVSAALAIIRRIHPYEEPLVNLIPLVNHLFDPPQRRAMAPEVAPRPADLPEGLARPTLRALHAAGITQLAQLAARTEAEVGQLHGMGPKALDRLRAALAERGMAFAGAAGDPPS